ncbi:hypothetical protein CcaverHIS002_0404230 [Cutaneotrichosporon cavernicola]|nr:hypothetical protein CcaverHIS002_0404230 [Cutaneotrichosporon cavernicola]
MSMLRYLSPGRGRAEGSNSSSTSPLLADAPSLKLHVMNWGVLILPAPDHAGDPRHDPILHGELDVRVSGPRRCKRIRVGLRSIIRLDMGGGRKIEEDVLFERKVEIIGASTDGIWLAPGSQRSEWVQLARPIPESSPPLVVGYSLHAAKWCGNPHWRRGARRTPRPGWRTSQPLLGKWTRKPNRG